jgi:pimeloyl-ACP methyl ester carboxylesterase
MNTETVGRARRKHGCGFSVLRGIIALVGSFGVLVLLGVSYQQIATAQDRKTHVPRGEFYTVSGHRMHIVCMGEGSPSVILEAGGTAESLWWHRVQGQLASHARVCAYDRPGHGWSDPATAPRDALTIVRELHALLSAADVPAPYVIVGHSYGALWARIFAAQYSDEVLGAALIDSSLLVPDHFESQSAFDAWKTSNDQIQAAVRLAYQTGLMRLTAAGSFQAAGYPTDLVAELAALQSHMHVYEADYAEQIGERWAFTEAAAEAKKLGDLPLAIVWASENYAVLEALPELRRLRDEITTYSSRSFTRIVEGASHTSLLGNEIHAVQVADAILDVIEVARMG